MVSTDLCLFRTFLAFNKKFYVHLYHVQNMNFVRWSWQFLPAVKFGSNLPEKLEPEGVMESGSRISYTKTLEEQTLVYLSVSPPNLSMMLVWNNLADPDLSVFSDFARFSQTQTLNIQYPYFFSVVQSPFHNWHSSFSPTTFFEIGVSGQPRKYGRSVDCLYQIK